MVSKINQSLNFYVFSGFLIERGLIEKREERKKKMLCPSCGSPNIESVDGAVMACSKCGQVLEESLIVSDVTFTEHSSGACSMNGVFVSEDGEKALRRGVSRAGRDSQENTLMNVRYVSARLFVCLFVFQFHLFSDVFLFETFLDKFYIN